MKATISLGAVLASFVFGTTLLAEEVSHPSPLFIDRQVSAVTELKLETGQTRLLVLSQQIGRIAVADPNVADLKVVTPTQVLLTAKGAGATDLTLWTRDNQPLVISLQVVRNLDALRKQLKDLFPDEKINVSAAGDLVLLSGQVSDIRLPERIAQVARLHSKEVANLVTVTGHQQVQLEVRFAEVSRTGLREIGVNFFYKAANGSQVGGLSTPRTGAGTFLNTGVTPTSIPGTGPGGINGQPPDVYASPFGNAFSIFFSNALQFPFSSILSLLESNGLAKVLAEPTLVTLSGQEAKFLAGGEFPVPLASTFGTVSVQWKKFGILLGFTPTVIDENTIHLKLASEVSDIDPNASITLNGITIPGLTSRQSETTVRLGDGQSFAIAGLLSDKVQSQMDRIPLLGSLPILGALFRSTSFRRDETELLVVVTARLAHPLAPHEVPPLPTSDEINDPNDFALFLLGLDGSAGTLPPPPNDRGPSGARGFDR